VSAAAHGHDTRVVASFDPVEEQAGEGEVAEVIRPELELEAVGGELTGVCSHDAGVVDEHVEAIVCGLELLRERADRIEAGEVQRGDLDFGAGDSRRDVASSLGPVVGVADGEHNPRAGPRKLARREEADAAVRAGYDGDAAVLVGDVGSGPFVGYRAIASGFGRMVLDQTSVA